MTTSPIYHADDDQLVREHDHAVPENTLTEAGNDLQAADAPQTEPDAFLVLTDAPVAEPDAGLAEPETDQTQQEHDDVTPPADQESPVASVSDDPGFPSDGNDGAEESGMGDHAPADPSLVSEAFTLPPEATNARRAGETVRAAGPWNEVQAMFVDDPRASIERAAGLVDDRVEELIQSLRERQLSMQSAWRAVDPGTEELRVALQHYRTFWNSLEDLPAPA
jgi:hypothetical protein